MKNSNCPTSAMLLVLGLAQASPALEAARYRDGCEPMVHEAWATTFEADGTFVSGHDRSATYCFYDGRADFSEYRGLNKENQPYYHGISITIFDDQRLTGRTLWAMVGTDGYTDIRLEWREDGKLYSENEGHDPSGRFIARTSSEYFEGGDFKFVMNRSYDQGKTWIEPRNVIEYLRSSAEPPPLPQSWSPRLPYAAGLVGEGGMILLDGMAWGKFTEDDNGQPAGFIFASVTPTEDGWVWRTLDWNVAEGITRVEDVALQ